MRVASRSTATSDTYQNADGSFTRRFYTGPKNYQASDGSWQPIDTTLIRRGDGRLHTTAHSLAVTLANQATANRGAADSLATLTFPSGVSVAYGLRDAAAASATISGSTATYANVLPSTDLRLEALDTGLKETLVLNSAEAPNSWVFPMRLNGLTPVLGADGSAELRDSAGAVVALIPAGVMTDSKFDPERGQMTTSSGVSYELVTVAGAPALKVTADDAWLHDPARVFPVLVDPTYTYTTGDVFVDNDSSTGSSQQNGVDLTVGTFNDGTTKARSFIHFDNYDDDGLIGKRITAANLHLYLSWTYDCNHPTTVSVYKVTQSWTVSNLSTSGLYGPSVSGPIGSAAPADNYPACLNTSADRSVGDWMTVPLQTATFQDWSLNGANNGVALIGPESGTGSKYGWKRFTSANYSSGQYRPYLDVTWSNNVAPQVNAQYPPSYYSSPTLRPELIVGSKDPDAFPYALTHNFLIYNKDGAQIAQSGATSARNWVVPAGVLTWGQSYFWTVVANDGLSASTSQTINVLSTPVPQPLVTSSLAQNGGQGFDTNGGGNYTTSATDATVASVGPALSVERSYNSRDPRVGSAFGAGWSSLFDAKATEFRDVAGALQTVVVTYPSGQEVAFGANANGTFSPPPGRFATFIAIAGGYRLVDKDGTAYAFTGTGAGAGQLGLRSITDPQGRAQAFTFDGSGHPTVATSASGRRLTLGWSTPPGATKAHVVTVNTDPVTAGDPMSALTWTYGYTGDLLTKVCPPTSTTTCTTYQYTVRSLYPSTLLNAGPRSYWRFGEASGTSAVSSVVDNAGTDNGTYANVTLGQPGPLPGATATAAGFNGTTSSVTLPKTLLTSATYLTASLWFKTTQAGPLMVEENQKLGSSTTPSHAQNPFYVGTDGKLHAGWYVGAVGASYQITSPQNVNDGAWHSAVLTATGNTQTLYLDGVQVGSTLSGVVNHLDMQYVYLGAGYSAGSWPGQAPAGWWRLTGSISDVAIFDRPLSSAEVSAIVATGRTGANLLTSVVRPSGNASATVTYDGATASVTEAVDTNGGHWHVDAPVVSGSYQVHSAAVLGTSPADYWRLAETGTVEAINEVNGNVAVDSGVTLGIPGGPFDDPNRSDDNTTVASFNGTSSYYLLPDQDIPTAGPNSIGMWFKTASTAGGTLFGFQTNDVTTSQSSTGNWVPALYIGTDGKLRGKFCWCGGSTPITSSAPVNNNVWHHVVLTGGGGTQTLYLDGAAVGTVSQPFETTTAAYAYLGAGEATSWPARPTNSKGYFSGQIAEVSFYQSQLSAAQVSAQFAARAASSGVPVKTVTITDPGNKPIRYIYDVATGRKVADVDALGNKTQYGYDTSGFLYTVTDPNGDVTTTEHDARGNTVSSKTCQDQSAQLCSTVFFTFDQTNDLMLTMRDGRSASSTDDRYKTTYAYDSAGNRTSATDPLGRVTTTVYTDGTTVAAADGGFAPAGLPSRLTTPGGAQQTVVYFKNGDVASVTDPAGKVTTYTYDGLGRALTTTDTTGAFPAGLTTSFSYDGLSRVRSQTAPAVTNRVTGAVHTAVTTTVYDDDGLVMSQTVTDTTGGDAPRTVSSTYNNYGQQITSTDAAGKTTTVEYDAYGRVVREIGADGGVVESAFDAEGQLLTSTVKNFTGDPNAPSAPYDLVVTSKAYDPYGRVATVTDAMGWQTLYSYTDNNLVSKVTRKDPSNGATFVQQESFYDGAGNLIKTKTNDGATTTTYVVDNAGRSTSSTLDPGGLNRTTAQTLSADDHVLNTTVSDPTGTLASTDTMYDALGRSIATTTSNGTFVPFGRWKLDETSGTTAADSAGNSPATASGGVTWSTEHGGSAVFNGTNAVITTPGAAVDTTRPFSMAAWVNLASKSADGFVLVLPGAIGNSAFKLFYSAASDRWYVSMAVRNVDGTNSWIGGGSATGLPTTGAWTHLAVTVDPSSGAVKLYVDSALQTTVTSTKAFNNRATGMNIGSEYNYGWFNGSINDVQLYQRALTASEVASVYNGTAPAANAGVVRTSRTLDQSGIVTSEIDPGAQQTDYSLDEAGRVAVVVQPAVLTEAHGGAPVLTRPVAYTGYDTFGAPVESKDPNGNVTLVAYDAGGRVRSTTMPDYAAPGSSTPITAVSTRTYDDVGQLRTSTNPLGKTTSYVYDQLGRLSKVTAPNLAVTTFAYDLMGDQTSETDPTGAVSTATYDYLGRQLTSTQVVRQDNTSYTTHFGYGIGGWLTSTTSPDQVTISLSYNAAAEAITSTDGVNNTTRFGYDGLGRRIKTTLPDHSYSTATFDMAGRLTAQGTFDTAGTLLSSTSVTYDPAGNATAATDAGGTTTRFGYDATGLLTSEVQPINGSDAITTSFGYDVGGNRTRFTDGRGNAFLTTYNSWGLPEDQIEPATNAHPSLAERTFTTSYDAAGRVATRVLPGGVTVTNTYDDTGLLVSQSGTGAEVATSDRSFGYDLAGRLTAASGPVGTNSLTYDDRGLLRSTTGGSGASTFTYTGDGMMASRADAAGTTSYVYDNADRLQSLANPTAGITASYSYNSLSEVNAIMYGSSGNVRWLGYDPSHRLITDELKKPGGASIAKIIYGWDQNGNETSKTTTGFAGSASNVYTYDLANRLISWDNGVTPTLYAYDKSGNRVQAGNVLFTYDERNELKSSDSGSVIYSYTPRGTLSATTNVGVSTLQTKADGFGQVRTQFVTETQKQDYEYDGLGRLVRSGAAYTGAAYTGGGNTLASDGSAVYTRDPSGALIGESAGGAQRLAWTDLHTDVVGQFEASGTSLAGSTTYDPLGKVLTSVGTIGSLGYQSEYTDTATGRVNMHARWYNPQTAQFDTRDSVDLNPVPDSVRANRFAYGDANPLVNTDPTGHCGWCSSLWNSATSKVSSTYNNVKSTVTTTWNYATTTVSNTWNSTYNWASERIDDAKDIVKQKLDQARRVYDEGRQWANDKIDKGRTWVNDQIDKGKKWVNDKVDRAKQKVRQAVNKVKQAGKKVVAQATRVVTQAVNTIKDAYQAASKWVVEHKDLLIEIAAVGVGILAGIACTAATAGAGAVACMVGAAALINLGKDAAQGKIHRVGDALGSLGQGALQGALGGIGGAAGGKLAGMALSKMGSFAGSLGGRVFGGGLAGGLGDAATQLLTTGKVDLGDVAVSAGIGAVFGGSYKGKASTGKKDPTGCRVPGALAHSFAPGTRVVMADGSTRPIQDINIGDQVKATDPKTAKTEAKPVTMLHLNRDRDLTNVTVAAKMGKVAAAVAAVVLLTTQHHPFWDQNAEVWTDAAQLKAGQSTLLSLDGTTQQVIGVDNHTGAHDMRDLTVADTHTYYVLAGDTPVLVHNCGTGSQTTILGENMTERVMPFADETGARTLGFGTTPERWSEMTPRQRWKLNDGQLRARIREGDDFRYIGQDPERPSAIRDRFDITRSELLRLQDRDVPYEIVSPSEVFATIGRY